MVVIVNVKNPKLKKRIFKLIKKNEDLAMKYFEKGEMAKGNKYDKRADKLYKDNYYKMFKIVKEVKK